MKKRFLYTLAVASSLACTACNSGEKTAPGTSFAFADEYYRAMHADTLSVTVRDENGTSYTLLLTANHVASESLSLRFATAHGLSESWAGTTRTFGGKVREVAESEVWFAMAPAFAGGVVFTAEETLYVEPSWLHSTGAEANEVLVLKKTNAAKLSALLTGSASVNGKAFTTLHGSREVYAELCHKESLLAEWFLLAGLNAASKGEAVCKNVVLWKVPATPSGFLHVAGTLATNGGPEVLLASAENGFTAASAYPIRNEAGLGAQPGTPGSGREDQRLQVN